MNGKWIRSMVLVGCALARPMEGTTLFSGAKARNNLVTDLLEVTGLDRSGESFAFTRSNEGWIFLSVTGPTKGKVQLFLDRTTESVLGPDAEGRPSLEAMRYIAAGPHQLRVEGPGAFHGEKLIVRAIPELIHCGLGFNPEIKSYGLYDLDFLQRDILPNVTTLVVPSNLPPPESAIVDWHKQGKKFVAEVGIDGQSKTAGDHLKYWSGFCERSPFLDGIIINEFIVNRPVAEWAELTPERLARMAREREQYQTFGAALRKIGAAQSFRSKMLYAYVGGSGKKLNQEIIGTNFVRALRQSGHRVVLERYLHEMSSEAGAQEAMRTFVEGMADWSAREPGIMKQMIIAFGLFSMPPGGINKQPNVDYHVWMDRQMNAVANHPVMIGLAGLEWWTSLLADEETVRFVGKLYRHYAIEGRTNRMIQDPLFLTHLRNADFEKGIEDWTLHPAEAGSIAGKSFPRYGRIEGRFMGLGRPADPEHIGDTFLWMRRSEKGPNRFSQEIKNLQAGRLYSMKMFSCDYQDLVKATPRKREESKAFVSVTINGVELDQKRSFSEVYASSPEPTVPVCITYHWKVFRATAAMATLTVSDWMEERGTGPFGQEQAFNFLEIQPYHE